MFNELRYSLRVLARTPAFSAAAIVILALAIGANTAVFSLVDTLVLQPRPGRIDALLVCSAATATHRIGFATSRIHSTSTCATVPACSTA